MGAFSSFPEEVLQGTERISWTGHVRKEEVLRKIKEETNFLHKLYERTANWIGHTLHRNCLLKHITEGKVEGRTEVTGRRGRRSNQLLDDLKEKRGCWKLKEETLDCTCVCTVVCGTTGLQIE